MGATVRPEWARTLRCLEHLNKPIGDGPALCLAPDVVPLDKRHVALPVNWL